LLVIDCLVRLRPDQFRRRNHSGAVRDSSAAAIAGAKIGIVHVETGVATNTVTNHNGFYSTPSLPIGNYKVHIESAGMRAWESDVTLETGKTAEINTTLTPGQITETVQVTASVPLVTTTDPTDGSTLDAKRIEELPVNGRDLNTLLLDVTPGLEDGGSGVRTGGLMVYSTNYVQDGATSNNFEFGGSGNLQGLDSIAEVRVETSTSSARYNRPASVIVSTKGGGNQVRGSIYETIRNNSFGVARARQDVSYTGVPYSTPKLIRNEFGGSIGGPVMLPSFGLNGKKLYNGRNRTFFFYSREGQELRQGVTRDYTVPTDAMRRGDFSDLYDSTGRKITLYDALTTTQITAGSRKVSSRLPFNNNVIPITRESPLAKFVWGITRVPNDTTNPLVTTNLKMVVPSSYTSYNPSTVRLDHRLSATDNFFVKFAGGNKSSYFLATGSATGAPTTGFESNVTYTPVTSLAGSLSWNHIFTPALFVETLISRTAQTVETVTGPVQQDWSKQLGLPNPMGEIGWPSLLNVGFSQYVEGDNRRSVRSLVSSAEQNYNWVLGTHNVQFGWRAYNEHQTLLPDQNNISGTAYFNSLATALESPTTGSTASPGTVALTGNDAANFFLGYAAQYQVGLKRGLLRLRDSNYSMYLQDSYKVTSRLTVTPGVRWDINPAFTEDHDLINTFDVKSHSVVLPQPMDYYIRNVFTSQSVVGIYQKVGVTFKSADEAGLPKQIFQSNNLDIGPRFGFAYRAFEGRKQFIIRGGYGLYLSAVPMRSLIVQFQAMPPFRATYSYNPNSAAQSPDGNGNYLLRTTPTIVAGQNSRDVIDLNNPISVSRGLAVNAMGPLPSLRVHEWNLALERQFGQATVLRLRYNGKHGVNADQLQNINPTQTNYVWYTTTGLALPTGEYANVARRPYDQTAYTDVQILQKTGYINTNIISVEMERRFSKGLAFQTFYTMTNSFRLAGNSFRDGIGSVPQAYIPGSVPTDPADLNRFLNYQRDTAIPKHRWRWNWNYDLPFGRGKMLLHDAPKWVDKLAGGWKFSGTGTVASTWFAMPTSNWGATSTFEVYGTKYPILDCRGTPANATKPQDERCFQGYLYYNGYISQRQIDSRNTYGMRNGVFGLPADYHPAIQPITPWPKGGQPGAPGSSDWDTDYVIIKLKNGANQRELMNTGLHPWRQQYLLGPFNWTTDASLMKYFQVTERTRFRFNIDVFNALNTQGLNTPGSDGIVTLQNSFSGFGIRPRQVQLTGRFEW